MAFRAVEESRGGHANPARVDSRAREAPPNLLLLGTNPEELVPDTEVAELERVANHLPGAVQRRMGEAYGADVAQTLARFQNPRESDAVRTEIAGAASGQNVPQWLEELASALFEDTGAQTRAGKRTGSMRLGPRQEPRGGHRGTEVETGATGSITPVGLVEQVRMSLAYAHDAWTGLMALRSAGKEGDWTLNEAEAGTNELAAGQHETLEAAREIGQALERIQRAFGDAHGEAGRQRPGAGRDGGGDSALGRTDDPHRGGLAGWRGGAGGEESGRHRTNRLGGGSASRRNSFHRQSTHRGLDCGGSGLRREPEGVTGLRLPSASPVADPVQGLRRNTPGTTGQGTRQRNEVQRSVSQRRQKRDGRNESQEGEIPRKRRFRLHSRLERGGGRGRPRACGVACGGRTPCGSG